MLWFELLKIKAPTSRVVVALHTPGHPVSIPHDDENRGAVTGIDQEPDPQGSDTFLPPPQVTDSARSTLSRWRHGFEPRWDYEQEPSPRTGQHWHPAMVARLTANGRPPPRRPRDKAG